MRKIFFLSLLLLFSMALAAEMTVTVPIHLVSQDGVGKSVGQVTINESEHGLVFVPDLNGIAPGLHGFHVHQNPTCEPKKKDGKMVPALSAGGHYDPHGTKKHSHPWGQGHLGDLPGLYVDDNGHVLNPVLAPRIKKLSEIKGRALMVHAGGDNYSDQPKKLGGGGARIACGVIQ